MLLKITNTPGGGDSGDNTHLYRCSYKYIISLYDDPKLFFLRQHSISRVDLDDCLQTLYFKRIYEGFDDYS